MISSVIFDFGGTLAVESDAVGLGRARRETARAMLKPASERQFELGWRRTLREFEEFETNGVAVSAASVASELVRNVLGRDDESLSEPLHRALVDPPSHPQCLQVVEGAHETLAELHTRGMSCGLLSNTGLSSGAYNTAWLRQVGLLSTFRDDAVLFSDEVGVGKPNRDAFDLGLARLRCRSEDAIYVGDDPWFDVYGARQANLLTVRVNRYGPTRALPEADIVVPDLGELISALARARLID